MITVDGRGAATDSDSGAEVGQMVGVGRVPWPRGVRMDQLGGRPNGSLLGGRHEANRSNNKVDELDVDLARDRGRAARSLSSCLVSDRRPRMSFAY